MSTHWPPRRADLEGADLDAIERDLTYSKRVVDGLRAEATKPADLWEPMADGINTPSELEKAASGPEMFIKAAAIVYAAWWLADMLVTWQGLK